MKSGENLRDLLNNLDSLPAVPEIARKILSLKLNTDEDDMELLGMIAQDPPIMSKIVGLSNSPLFNTGRSITKLDRAVTLLGIKRVKTIALSFSMISSMTRKSAGQLNIQSLWKHSLAIAMAMEILACFMPQDRRPEDDEIYLAGLLHNIGFFVLDYIHPQLSDKFHARLATEINSSLQEVEAEMLGISLGEIGAMLGRYWNLPEAIVASMNHQTDEDDQTATERSLGVMANLAEKMLPPFEFTEFVLKDPSEKEWRSLGIDPLSTDEIKLKVQEIVMKVNMLDFQL
jgi:HD-like signal output (HDOD) protein